MVELISFDIGGAMVASLSLPRCANLLSNRPPTPNSSSSTTMAYGSHPLSLLYCKCNLLVWPRAAAVRLLFSLHDGAAQCSTMACAIDLVASLKIESLIFFCLLCFLYLLACCKLSGAAEPNVFYFCWTRLVQSDPTHSWLGWFGLGLVWKKAKSDPTQPVLFWSVRITDLGKFDRNQPVYTPWIDRVNPYTHL